MLTQYSINLVLILKNIQNKDHMWRYRNVPHCKCMKNRSFKGIDEPYDPSISWNKNKFSIIAELQASPLTSSVILHLKGSKWTLQKRKTDVGMQQNYSRCSDHFAKNTLLGRLCLTWEGIFIFLGHKTCQGYLKIIYASIPRNPEFNVLLLYVWILNLWS